MAKTTIRFTSFPRTEPPPVFVTDVVEVFRRNEDQIATERLSQHLKSDEVLRILLGDLVSLGFEVEKGKTAENILARPVFFGENGAPTLRFEVDAYHPIWRCGLEIEASRGIRGGAFYRDLIQAMVMVGVSHMCIAVQNRLEYGKAGVSKDYPVAVNTAQALYGHSRLSMPFTLTVIGY